jgi:hypothetical protein
MQVEYVNPSVDVKASAHMAQLGASVAPGCVSRRGDNVSLTSGSYSSKSQAKLSFALHNVLFLETRP